ncbi:MAG: hypothetical protein LUF90_11400 [Rikenellaceae bacterium]|nr:hypothetical protein [Rikenellaceae bacterium]
MSESHWRCWFFFFVITPLFSMTADLWSPVAAKKIVLFSITLALLLIAFSRQKIEDEYTQKVRLESLLWALLINFIIVLLAVPYRFLEKYMFFDFYLLILLYIHKMRFTHTIIEIFDKHEE